MSKHTPGPLLLARFPTDWDPVEYFRALLAAGDGSVWGVVAPLHEHSKLDEHGNVVEGVFTAVTGNGPASLANAHLYAAAPDLFEALDTTAQNIRSLQGAHPGVTIWDVWLRVVDEALAKARGGSR